VSGDDTDAPYPAARVRQVGLRPAESRIGRADYAHPQNRYQDRRRRGRVDHHRLRRTWIVGKVRTCAEGPRRIRNPGLAAVGRSPEAVLTEVALDPRRVRPVRA